jgi:hypothetical protein
MYLDKVLAVVGNKIDRTEEEAVSYNEVKQYAESIGAIFKLTSAKDGKGVNVALPPFRKYFQQSLNGLRNCKIRERWRARGRVID